jgi:hypothetical protein
MCLYLTLLVFRVLCILVFWELYPICMIHWINKLYPNHATAMPRTSRPLVVTPNPRLTKHHDLVRAKQYDALNMMH